MTELNLSQSVIHKARCLDFAELMDGLERACKQGSVLETKNKDGLSLFVYTSKCVYEKQWDEFSILARGLILDLADKRLIATPFPKFFNLGEGDSVWPLGAFETFEKVDGSLIIVFYHCGRWQCATKGSFYSDQALWAQARLESSDLSSLDKGTTYLFEAIYPENRIVIRYEESALVLLGAYDEAGFELNYSQLKFVSDALGFRLAKRFEFQSLHELSESARSLGLIQEGFVVRFADGLRLKIKTDDYLRIHSMISRVTPLAIWEHLVGGADLESIRRELPEEFWQDFDQIVSLLREQFDKQANRARELVAKLAHLTDKEIGLRLAEFEPSLRPFIFACRKEGASFPGAGASQTILRQIRPVRNFLPGYLPGRAMQRVQEEI